MDWLLQNMPSLIAAMDVQKELTSADIDEMLYYIGLCVTTQKRQSVSHGILTLRAYSDAADTDNSLHISVQKKDAG